MKTRLHQYGWLSALGLVGVLAFGAALAQEQGMRQDLREARLEGQLWTTFALNRHLNPFEIGVDVQGETAILTGEVDDAVDKELAERLALNASGITRVDNRITVNPDWQTPRRDAAAERTFGEFARDATTTASVKSKLLWNDTTDGLDIDVDTLHGKVTLSGTADTEQERALAERLALQTDGVVAVDNQLAVGTGRADVAAERVDSAAERTAARTRSAAERGAAATERGVERASGDVSDAWITTKVKSSLLISKNVEGTDMNVDTKDGAVRLSGQADTTAERDLAIEIARDIKGVRSVDASAVTIGSTRIAERDDD